MGRPAARFPNREPGRGFAPTRSKTGRRLLYAASEPPPRECPAADARFRSAGPATVRYSMMSMLRSKPRAARAPDGDGWIHRLDAELRAAAALEQAQETGAHFTCSGAM